MKEEKIQIAISKYIKNQYPNIIFTAESSGVRLPMGLAVKVKKQRSKHKHLDLIILEPRCEYHGLILELKKSRDEVFKKNGEMRDVEHIQKQWETIQLFRSKGYFSGWGLGFDETKKVIDNYMKL